MLNRAAILVVEDEAFIALDIAFAVEDADGIVVGPAASVADALALLARGAVAGAILDVNLPDGDISPVVELLLARRVPMIVQSGVGLPAQMELRFPGFDVLIKPVPAVDLVTRLHGILAAAARQGAAARPAPEG